MNTLNSLNTQFVCCFPIGLGYGITLSNVINFGSVIDGELTFLTKKG